MDVHPNALSPPGATVVSGDDARELIDRSQTAHVVVQVGRIVYANQAFAEQTGWALEDLLGQDHGAVTPPEHRERVAAVVARRLAGKVGRPGRMSVLLRDGRRLDARVLATRVSFRGLPAVLITLHDVSELSQALHRARWSAEMLERTEALCRSGSFEIALPAGLVTPSIGLRRLVGLADDAPLGVVDALEWVLPDERDFVAGIWRGAEPGEPFDFQHRVLTAQGERLIVLHRGLVERDEAGMLRGVALLQDITAQRQAEQRLQDLATLDEVTGLANRACFLDKVDAAIVAAGWEPRIVTLLAIDVPRIGELHERMGFGAADALAMTLAARLQQDLCPGETAARLGSQEFGLMLELPQEPEQARVMALGRAEALRRKLEQPLEIGATRTFARCVVGVASYPGDARSPAGLLELAQTARLRAEVESPVVLYEPASNLSALREMRVEALLRQAIDEDELELRYQPQVDLSDGRIAGVEALLHWTSRELGPVEPDEFVRVAERTGLIGRLGDWVLRRVCRQIAAWRAESVPAVRVALNLSPMQLQRRDLAAHIQSILIGSGADPAQICIEVTEGAVMADVAHAAETLREIKALGIEVALDDFGTGYSSLSCLRSLPIDLVKVDRSFVHDVTAAPEDVSVTRAIITMAHGLQLRVLAEGVETDGQLSLLSANRCDLIQGARFSEALPPEACARLLREGRCLPERFLTRARSARTLLLVDDEEHVLASLKRLLRRDGHVIVTAASAAEGLQRLAENEVDVIVSDQRMPGMTGVEFLRRAKELYPNTIRMVLSGYTELQSIIDAINEGAIYKFLTKPWDDALLREHVGEAFRQKAMADENRRLARQVEAANADFQALNERLAATLAQQRNEAELVALAASGTRDALQSLPAAVLIVDSEGALAYANTEALRLSPSLAAELGGAASDVLLPCLRDLPARTPHTGEVREWVDIDGRSHMALCKGWSYGDHPAGHLLMLMPADRLQGV